jgi:cyanophycinase
MYRAAFAGIGVSDVQPLALRERGDASAPAVLDAIATSGGVFVTGGSQTRLLDALRDTPAHVELRDLWRRGGVVVGTSAGASALGQTVISGTEPVTLSLGLGFVPAVLIDQHFSQRDRMNRLRDGLGRAPEHLGIGIDEDTALVIHDDDATVIGSGQVTVVLDDGTALVLTAGDHLALPATAPMR